jgi:hypothetical protein
MKLYASLLKKRVAITTANGCVFSRKVTWRDVGLSSPVAAWAAEHVEVAQVAGSSVSKKKKGGNER